MIKALVLFSSSKSKAIDRSSYLFVCHLTANSLVLMLREKHVRALEPSWRSWGLFKLDLSLLLGHVCLFLDNEWNGMNRMHHHNKSVVVPMDLLERTFCGMPREVMLVVVQDSDGQPK